MLFAESVSKEDECINVTKKVTPYIYRDVGRGKWCGRPRPQSPRGGEEGRKINVLYPNVISALKIFKYWNKKE
jgi:hypothetical protein